VDLVRKSFILQAAFVVVMGVLGGVVFYRFDLLEVIYVYTRTYENWQLDEVVGVVVGLGLAATFVTWHRNAGYLSAVRARIEAEKAGHLISRLDILTGLPNRSALNETLQELDHGSEAGAAYLLMIDLNRFKPLNDLRGHAAGDAILRRVAERLNALPGQNISAFRVGGDEFALLLTGARYDSEAVALAEQVVVAVAKPFVVEDWRETLSCSVGIAKADQRITPTEVINHADQAMYHAKSGCPRGWAMFDTALGEALREKALLAAELRDAVHFDTLLPFFQPILRIDNGELIGFEVLARWRRGDKGYVPPDLFIPLAEELGLIDRLSDQLLRRCCAAMASWDPKLTISFNLSPRQLNHEGLAKRIGRILDEAGIAGNRLAIEITETAVFIDMDRARAVISELRALGVRVSLDDFGIGTSSLAVLSQLPFDTIKIDRSFISDIEHNPQNAKIVRGVLAMARSLELTVTAEGIESDADLAFLKVNNCVLGQGYFFSRPVPEDALPQLVEDVARAAATARGEITQLPVPMPAVAPVAGVRGAKGRAV
jgi:diguanylate cyclase (GGDEF)-like protein